MDPRLLRCFISPNLLILFRNFPVVIGSNQEFTSYQILDTLCGSLQLLVVFQFCDVLGCENS